MSSLHERIRDTESALTRVTAEWAALVANGDYLTAGQVQRVGQLWRAVGKYRTRLENLRHVERERRERVAELVRASEALRKAEA